MRRSPDPDPTRPERAGGAIPRSQKDQPTVIPDNPNWHRFKSACPFYRERWVVDDQWDEGRLLLYQVICLQNTPPETVDDQMRCMGARAACWRLKSAVGASSRAAASPAAACSGSAGG